MATLKELQEQKNQLAANIKTLADKHDSWTQEDRDAWAKVNADYDAKVAEMDAERAKLEASEAVQKRLKDIEDQQKQATGDRRVGLDENRRKESEPERRDFRDSERRALAVQAWAMIQCGMELRDAHAAACRELTFNPRSKDILFDAGGSICPLGHDTDLPIGTARRQYGDASWWCGGVQKQRESRAGLDVATVGAGQETIPRGFMAELDKATLAYGNVRQVARVVNTATGNSVPWPTVTDTANVAAILAEATTIGASVDPTFSSITLLAYKLSSKPVFVSNEILQDSAFNLASELAMMIGERFGRGENVYFTTGTNSSQPQGIVTAAGTGVTTSSATAFTTDELISLVHSLDPSYRALPSTGFMMHDTAIMYTRKFKDSAGQYLWQPGMIAGVPDRLLGFPVSVNQQMEPLVSNLPVTAKKHVLFGAFEKYIVRDAGGVRMYHLLERYRDVDQDCFVAFKRIDGRALNTAALKVLLQA